MALFNYYPYSNFHELNLDWLIKIVKKYTEETDALEIKVDDFIAYVTNYLENLDVQEEIDQKLEEMKENGELAELIAEFLQTTSLIVFKTKALMKSAENLADGITVLTDGTDAYNDGETRLYYIRNITSSDVVDEINLVSLANYPTLVAEWLKDNYSGVFDSIKDEMVTYAEQNMDFNNTSVFNDIKDEMLSYVNEQYQPFKSGSILYIYVDAINGSDNNDGLTEGYPLKTAQKALDYVKKGNVAIFIRFLSNADYYISDYEFSNFSWHMSAGDLTNVTLHFINGCRLYDCHVNWANISVTTDNDDIPYQDSNYCLFQNVNFLKGYNCNGGMLNMKDCILPHLVIRRSNFTLSNTNFTGQASATDQSLLVITDASHGQMGGTMINTITKPTGEAQTIRELVNISSGASINLGTLTINDVGVSVTNSIRLSGSLMFIPYSEYTRLNGIYPVYKVSPSLVVNTNFETGA